ncbi:MAG: sulfite exporter TauE/SafE family protein [Metallosphaera sp.]|uniref:sulfite exporter TauE/SafE family protein n=1 Tax=Metallosphaera sp. TaxID=2020860 RepID=UPI00315E8549
MDLLGFIIIGVLVGALVGVTGSSGVLIVVPGLTLLGYRFQTAVSSSLIVDLITTVSVVLTYFRYDNVRVRTGLLLGLGAVVGAQIGSRVAVMINPLPLEIGFTFFAAVMAVVSFLRSRSISFKRVEVRFARVLSFLLSVGVGILTGTIGTSGGIMFIAIMMAFYNYGVKEMIGTATFSMFLSALSGVSGYVASGVYDLDASVVIGSTALIVGTVFAKVANRMKPSTIYQILGSVFVITCISEISKIF